MPTFKLTFVVRRRWVGVALTLAVVLALITAIIGVARLPGLLFGTQLTPAEAEESIRGHLLAQAALSFQERAASTTDEARERLLARYAEATDRLKAITFDAIDVDTVIFSAFRIRRSFVVKVVMHGKDQRPSTHYFCFMDKYLTGACSPWYWWFAW
jgi:hypothetical protein